MAVTAQPPPSRVPARPSARLGTLWKIRSKRRNSEGEAVADEDTYVSPTEAVSLIKPKHGATAIREFADNGLLRVLYTAGGHRRIERDSIDDLNKVLAMRRGPEKTSAMESLRRRNLGESEPAKPAE